MSPRISKYCTATYLIFFQARERTFQLFTRPSYVYVRENTSSGSSVTSILLLDLAFVAGELAVAGLAYLLRNWFPVLLAIHAPFILGALGRTCS